MTIPVHSRPHTPASNPPADTTTQPTTTHSPSRRPSQSGELTPLERRGSGSSSMSAAQQSARRVPLPPSRSSSSSEAGPSTAVLTNTLGEGHLRAPERRSDEDMRITPVDIDAAEATHETAPPKEHGTSPLSETAPASPLSPGIVHARLHTAADLAAHSCETAQQALAFLYAPLKGEGGRDAAEVDAFVERQAGVLRARGIETKAQFDAVCSKAAMLDLVVHKPIEGVVGSAFFNASDAGFGFGAPFGSAATPGKGASVLAKVGILSSMADVANGPVKDRLTKDRAYTNPSPETLDPVMRGVTPPSAWHEGGKRALAANAGFSGRNAVRLAAEGIMIARDVPAEVRAKVQQYMSSLGGSAAGMVMYTVKHMQDVKDRQAGPAQFFARTDLGECLDRLNKPLTDQAADAFSSMGSAAAGAFNALTRRDREAIKDGLMGLLGNTAGLAKDMAMAQFSPAGLASHAVLTSFFSAVGSVAGSSGDIKAALARQLMKANPTMALEQATNLADIRGGVIAMVGMFALLAVAYATWGFSPEAGNAVKDMVKSLFSSEDHATLSPVDDGDEGHRMEDLGPHERPPTTGNNAS
jgi:hypothetical protein